MSETTKGRLPEVGEYVRTFGTLVEIQDVIQPLSGTTGRRRMSLCIYRFHWHCGRMGDLDGVFVEDPEKVRAAIGKQVYFGEVLGKHSDINGVLDEGDLELVSDDQEFVAKFVEIMGEGTVAGHNPMEYLEDSE